ncbi:MAG: polyprenyl synthetase family protein [Bacteroidales bacterium]|nr:polyprenyl synthetase family protein [Bacteroidales bacterium]
MIAQAKTFLGSDWQKFEELFEKKLSCEIPLLNKVNQYLLARSGKQLRPVLAMLAAHLCAGYCSPASVACAVSSEMIHTATLLHDDVADDSDTRRGSPTVSALISPRASVLVGDYWLARGVTTLIDMCNAETFRYFSVCLDELSRGEMFQIEKAASLDTTYDDYIRIISCKTASLFRAAMKSGARNSGCSDAQLESMDAFALHLGLAFQMRDDILDYSPSLSIGKPTMVDIVERKITLPLICAFDNAGAAAREEVIKDIDEGRTGGVLSFVEKHGGIAGAQAILERETAQATGLLGTFPDSAAKDILCSLAGSLCLREA